MTPTLILEKKITDGNYLRGTHPGVFDFDYLVESDVDAYGIDGRPLFKFRKNAMPAWVNDSYPSLADICVKTVSLRLDAVGHELAPVAVRL